MNINNDGKLILNMANNNVVKPTNKLKNNGINISAKGIKNLKFSSKVREFVIQDIPLK